MSTLNYERGKTFPTIKRETLYNTDDQSELHKDNTFNSLKGFSLKSCKCMIQFLCSVKTLNFGNTYSYDDEKLSSRFTLTLFHTLTNGN